MLVSSGNRTRGRAVTAVVLAGLLTASGCDAVHGSTDPAATASAHASLSGPTDSSSKVSTGTLTWEFEHIADFSGKFEDVAGLAADDIWAVATENDGRATAHLLHYDGKSWKQESFPDALGESLYAPRFEEVGEGELWLRPQNDGSGTDENWARWDGTRWSAVPNPPPGKVGDFEATGPDDIWTLLGEQSAQHWDGSRWSATRLPFGMVDLAVAGPKDVWAVGGRDTGPGTELGGGERYSQPASAHWDGASWKPVDTPQARFDEPLPPEPGAGLLHVFAFAGDDVRAYGSNSFNHGEVDNEPADEFIQLRWDGSKWAEQDPAPGGCDWRTPVGRDGNGLFLDGNWYLTDDGRCVKIGRHRLPTSTGAGKGSHQSLWLKEIHRVPGTDEWLGAGQVEVNQSGDPFSAPVVVRLKRGAA
ncbi:hypothetical protein ABZ341_08425 [Streptomyces sp. NPDC006173]|uniref:hypothetical protein n=1 Tax=Streptomyces sp. NPDC006173 TaxID=3155349 RepID=UPI0033F2DCA0